MDRRGGPIDCLIVGCNQLQFADYERALRGMGEQSGAYRDLRPSFYRESAQLVTCRDFCNRKFDGPGFSYDDIFSATIAYLGSYLDRHGLTFGYINSFQEGREQLSAALASGEVRCVAITTTYYVSMLPLLEVIAFVRKIAPEVPIIVGGPYIRTQQSIHQDDAFRYLIEQIGADFYVVSDQGEATLALLVEALKTDQGFSTVPNLIWLDGAGYHRNALVAEDNELAENLVNWSLFSDALPPRDTVMVRTARSCPFSCAFCSFPEHAGDYRYLSPSDIWRELDAIEALGCVRSVTFIDDTFNVPPRRFREILTGLRDRKYSFRWNCNFRCQYATRELVELMREAGCEGVFLGIESGSDAVLATMNKQASAEAYARGIGLLRAAGILTYASFVVGFPGETNETVRTTIDFIERTAPDFFRAQLWYYDTMTPIHRDAAKFGLRNSQFEWIHNTMNARQAANWVAHMHRTIGASVWLPQNDFDFPALFCLLARGWSIDRIKLTVREFNQQVLMQMAEEERQRSPRLDPALLANAGLDFGDQPEFG